MSGGAKDFRADRLRTKAIVATGSGGPGLLIYSSSNASNYQGGTTDPNMLSQVGTDVWMFVSGSGTADGGLTRGAGSSVLFGGDVVVSGTLWAERSVVEVTDSVTGDFQAPNKLIAGHLAPANGFARVLVDPTTANNAGVNRTGTVSFNVVQGTAGGVYTYPTANNHDVFFHVSGSRGVQGTNDRGVALFEGDVFISGNLKLGPHSTFTTGPTDELEGSDGTIWLKHSGSGNSGFYGTLQIAGDAIKNSEDLTVISWTGPDVYVSGSLQLSGNQILNNEGELTISLDKDQRVGIGGITPSYMLDVNGDVRIRGNDIRDNSGGVAVAFDGSANTAVQGSLTLGGQEIKDAGGDRVLFVSGSGNATFENNLTVVGDLNVSGSVTSIATDNLRVKDQLVLLASGAAGPNVAGGIAIASGSTITNESLLWGTGLFSNSFRASRLDVQDGSRTSGFSSGEPVRIETAGLRFKTDVDSKVLLVTSSLGGDTYYHITASNTNGDILLNTARRIRLKSSNDVHIDQGQSLYFDDSSRIRADGGGTGRLYMTFSDALEFTNSSEIHFSDRGKIIGTGAVTGGKLAISGSGQVDIHAMIGPASDSANMRTSRILLSGSADEAAGGPIIVLSSSAEYGSSTRQGFITVGATPPEVDSLFTLARHRDVRTLLSGTIGSAGSNTRGVTLVDGDLVVSGNTSLQGTTEIAALSLANLTLASNGYLRFGDVNNFVDRSSNTLRFRDDDLGAVKTLRDLTSLSVTDNTDVFTISGGEPSYIKTTGSFSFDTDDQYTTAVNGGNTDIYFYVSGAIGSAGSSTRGTAVFGGDLHISGNISAEGTGLGGTLQQAYNGGNVIDIAGGSPLILSGAVAATDTVLSVTGSIDVSTADGGGNARLKIIDANRFEFHNSAGEVFRMLAGASGTHLRLPNSNELRFEDDTRGIYGLTEDTIKKIKLINRESGGTVSVQTNSGRMEVTGSLYPGADSTYDLGSPSYRWANLYTGDLHLRNERGDWTIYEEPDMLVVVNNLTGKRYKMNLTPLEDDE